MRRVVSYAVITGLLAGSTFGTEAQVRDDVVRLSPRVRSTHPAIAAMLKEASARSITFRELVGGIERTDGIVYVEPGVCRHGVRACLSLSIAGGGGVRILRVIVNLATDVIELMATIGHELRHALEILSEPGVRTAEQAYLYYAREAPTVRDAFETAAAIRVGTAVRAELGRR
jgi:hypothetical protein